MRANLPAFAVFREIFVFMFTIGQIGPPSPGLTFDDISDTIRTIFVRYLEVLSNRARKSSKITKIRYCGRKTGIAEAPAKVII